MRFFTGQHDRTIDSKNRIQLPSEMRDIIDPKHQGATLYLTLGEHRRTLSIFAERAFEELATRTETEFQQGDDALAFELQFFTLTSRVEMDKQGRFVVPEKLLKKARLAPEVYLVGQKNRIDIWNREDLDRSIGIDWEGDAWPQWRGFLRNRPRAAEQA